MKLTFDENEETVLTKEETEIISDYRELSEQGQEYILQTMDLAKSQYKKRVIVLPIWKKKDTIELSAIGPKKPKPADIINFPIIQPNRD